jgi:hypothetical protein
MTASCGGVERAGPGDGEGLEAMGCCWPGPNALEGDAGAALAAATGVVPAGGVLGVEAVEAGEHAATPTATSATSQRMLVER